MTTQIPRLLDENEAMQVFLDAQAGSSLPIGVLRGIRAVIAWWESPPQVSAKTTSSHQHRVDDALNANGCERIKDFYAVGPAQRAAVESFVDALWLVATHDPTAKVVSPIENSEPVSCMVYTAHGIMVWPISGYNEALAYCDEGVFPTKCYAQPAPRPEPLSVDEYTAIAQQTAATYSPQRGPSYTFLPYTLGHFTRAIESAYYIKKTIK